MNRARITTVAAIAAALCLPTSVLMPAHASTPAGEQASALAAQEAGRGSRGGRQGTGNSRDSVRRTLSPGPDLGYGYDMNPLPLPAGMAWARHVSSVAINSKGHIFVFHRAAEGKPQLLEFDQHQKFVRGFGEDIALRAHSMLIDGQDNIWITDQNGGTLRKLSPDGKVLWTIGVQGKEGDWDEATGSHLLWQPLAVALAPNGDIYIGMGHAGESASRGGGAARILHLDKNGKYVNQWFGNARGPGHFTMVHALAMDSKGNLYIADREEYRVVVYDAKGHFVRTIQKPNLVCSIMVTKDDEMFLATGADGQVEKIDADGKVLGSTGLGPGTGIGQFGESCDMAMDAKGDIYVSDGINGRVTKLIAPKNRS